MPVASLLEFLFDDIADEQYLAPSEQVGNDKCSKGRDKYHRNPAYDAWYA